MNKRFGKVFKMNPESDVVLTLIPTAGVRFSDQVKVLRAYAVLGTQSDDGVHYREVVRVTRLARTQISGLNSFLVMLGLLCSPKRGYYKPVPAVATFSGKNPGEEDFASLKDQVSKSRLYTTAKRFFLVHGVCPREDFVGYLTEEARSSESARADSAVEWLLRVGLLHQDEQGSLSLSNRD